MKIKADFVTNSSTTSYVFIGYHIIETPEIKEFIENYNGKYFVGGVDDGAEDGYVLLGSRLLDIDEYEPSSLNLSDLEKEIENIEKEFGIKFNLSKSNIKLIGAIRMS